MIEESVSELKDRSIEIIHSEEKKEKMTKNMSRPVATTSKHLILVQN